MTLFDERDQAIERLRSQYTLTVAAVVLLVGAWAARLLTATNSIAAEFDCAIEDRVSPEG